MKNASSALLEFTHKVKNEVIEPLKNYHDQTKTRGDALIGELRTKDKILKQHKEKCEKVK